MPERLAALDVPVLVVFGAADPRWEPSSAHQDEAVPDARIELLPRTGCVPPRRGAAVAGTVTAAVMREIVSSAWSRASASPSGEPSDQATPALVGAKTVLAAR